MSANREEHKKKIQKNPGSIPGSRANAGGPVKAWYLFGRGA
jgi:hypothetical protein